MLFQPTAYRTDFEDYEDPTKLRDVVVTKAVRLDEKGSDHLEYQESNILQNSLIPLLKGAVGGMVLGRVVQVKKGKFNAYGLADPTPEDEKVAERYLAASEKAPF